MQRDYCCYCKHNKLVFLGYNCNNLGSGIIFRMIDFSLINLFKLLVRDNVMLVVDLFSIGLPAKRMLWLMLRQCWFVIQLLQ